MIRFLERLVLTVHAHCTPNQCICRVVLRPKQLLVFNMMSLGKKKKSVSPCRPIAINSTPLPAAAAAVPLGKP